MESNALSILVCSILAVIILLLLLAMWYLFHVGLPRHIPQPQTTSFTMERSLLEKTFRKNGKLLSSKNVALCGDELGEGQSGSVFVALQFAPDSMEPLPVAVKVPKSDAHSGLQLLREAKLLMLANSGISFVRSRQSFSSLNHNHIVKILGVCMDSRTPMLIMERLATSLLAYLLEIKVRSSYHCSDFQNTFQNGEKPELTVRQTFRILKQVAQAGAFLHRADFTHRDIAARNVLLTALRIEDANAKLGDFGLSRQLYHGSYYRVNDLMLPIAWTAPEVIKDKVSCPQGDIWSYGVLIYEILMKGETPRPGHSAERVIRDITSPNSSRRFLPRPPVLSQQPLLHPLWDLAESCWTLEPLSRPSFAEIDQLLSEIAIRKVSEGTPPDADQLPPASISLDLSPDSGMSSPSSGSATSSYRHLAVNFYPGSAETV